MERPDPRLFNSAAAAAPIGFNSGSAIPPVSSAGGTMGPRFAGDLATRSPPVAAAAAPQPAKPPKTAKKAVGISSGEAFGVVAPVQVGGSFRSAPSPAMAPGVPPGGSFRPAQPPFGGVAGGSLKGPPPASSQPPFGGVAGGSLKGAPPLQMSPPPGQQLSPRGVAPSPAQPVIPDNVPLVSGTDQPIVRCVCTRCGKLFYFASDLETHTRLRHAT